MSKKPKLTKAQKKFLGEASCNYSVPGEGPQRRMAERLASMGLLEKRGLRSFEITKAGRAALANAGERK